MTFDDDISVRQKRYYGRLQQFPLFSFAVHDDKNLLTTGPKLDQSLRRTLPVDHQLLSDAVEFGCQAANRLRLLVEVECEDPGAGQTSGQTDRIIAFSAAYIDHCLRPACDCLFDRGVQLLLVTAEEFG